MSTFASSSKPKLSLQNPSLMGLTPEQLKFITEIEDFIKNTILPSGVPILEDEFIPKPTRNVLPESANGTGYISSNGKYAIKNIDYMKMIKNNSLIYIDGIKESLTSELINYHAISKQCPKYFCKLIGYKYNYDTHILTIVMENCGKDLFDFYNGPESDLEPGTIINHIYQLLKILECLHSAGFVHFDLKLENIVMDRIHFKGENNTDRKFDILKLIDAGTLTNTNDSNSTEVFARGTSNFIAPELRGKEKINNNIQLKASDIYSLGIILIAIVFDKNFGLNHIYEDANEPKDVNTKKYYNVFSSWKEKITIDNNPITDEQITNRVNNEFKKYFGDDIRFEHFFSKNPTERLTIQTLLSMFETKMEAYGIANKLREAERIENEIMEARRIETERREAHRIENERREAERREAERREAERIANEIREAEREEAERRKAKREAYSKNTDANNISDDVFGPIKRTYGMGGNKSKKPRRKRNNKSKRRQRKSRSK